jgi:hypothetical protein
MTDDKTQHGQWPLPHPGNKLSEDVIRLREALVAADAAIKTLQLATAAANNAIGTKAAADHGHGVATPSVNGFMAAGDKGKLDGIQAGATAYSHPAQHAPSIIVQDANNRFFTDAERQKLSGIQAGATAYSHPAQHAPGVITQDANNRFVTDAEKTAWNAKMGVGAFGLGGACVTVTSFNATPDACGYFMGSNVPGAPTPTGWWLVQQLVHNARWKTQLAFGMAGNDGQFLFRQGTDNGTAIIWGAWSSNMTASIKSVQRGLSKVRGTLVPGTNEYVANVTIAAVNLSKSFITTSTSYAEWDGMGGQSATPRVRLTSPTNLEITVSPWDIPSQTAWEVVEFF